MSRNQVLEAFEVLQMKKRPEFSVGDTVKVHTKIIEGKRERIQIFTGVVIARKGTGVSETFSVYREAYGTCMERVFYLHSPRVSKIEIERKGKVRRAKLNYLRQATGKNAKIKEKIIIEKKKKDIVEAIKTGLHAEKVKTEEEKASQVQKSEPSPKKKKEKKEKEEKKAEKKPAKEKKSEKKEDSDKESK